MTKKYTYLLISFLMTASFSAKAQSPIGDFFGKLVGTWNFQASQDIGFNADGTMWRNWEMYKHFKKVESLKGSWEFNSSFCTRSPGHDMCSESLLIFKMVGKKLMVTLPENSTDAFPVEVLSSSPFGISIRFSLGMTSITQTHSLSSDGLWSEVIQVYSGDKLTAVQIITSKRIAN